MKDDNFIKKLIDSKIIGSSVFIEKVENHLEIKMKKSKSVVKIPLKTDKDVAYLIGVIYGDGNLTCISRKISKYPRTKMRIYNNSKIFIDYISKLIQKRFNCRGNLQRRPGKDCYIYEVNNKIVWSYFVNIIGLKPKKKINLMIPQVVKNKMLFRYFLAGLMDTDGYYIKSHKSAGIMLNGTNYKFLQNIKRLSKQFYGIRFNSICRNTLRRNNKTYHRVSMVISKSTFNNFSKMPLRHEKWVEAEIRSFG